MMFLQTFGKEIREGKYLGFMGLRKDALEDKGIYRMYLIREHRIIID
ncbi:MAG: hypothetical protein QXN22_03345 [Thermofilaceae archaeon]